MSTWIPYDEFVKRFASSVSVLRFLSSCTVPTKRLCSALLKVRRLVYNVSLSVCLLTGYVTLQEHAVIAVLAVLSLVAVAVLLQCSTFGGKNYQTKPT